jgi:hypothetical protein
MQAETEAGSMEAATQQHFWFCVEPANSAHIMPALIRRENIHS